MVLLASSSTSNSNSYPSYKSPSQSSHKSTMTANWSAKDEESDHPYEKDYSSYSIRLVSKPKSILKRQTSSSRLTSRTVNFDKQEPMTHKDPSGDWTEEERRNVWFSNDEIAEMQKSLMETLQMEEWLLKKEEEQQEEQAETEAKQAKRQRRRASTSALQTPLSPHPITTKNKSNSSKKKTSSSSKNKTSSSSKHRRRASGTSLSTGTTANGPPPAPMLDSDCADTPKSTSSKQSKTKRRSSLSNVPSTPSSSSTPSSRGRKTIKTRLSQKDKRAPTPYRHRANVHLSSSIDKFTNQYLNNNNGNDGNTNGNATSNSTHSRTGQGRRASMSGAYLSQQRQQKEQQKEPTETTKSYTTPSSPFVQRRFASPKKSLQQQQQQQQQQGIPLTPTPQKQQQQQQQHSQRQSLRRASMSDYHTATTASTASSTPTSNTTNTATKLNQGVPTLTNMDDIEQAAIELAKQNKQKRRTSLTSTLMPATGMSNSKHDDTETEDDDDDEDLQEVQEQVTSAPSATATKTPVPTATTTTKKLIVKKKVVKTPQRPQTHLPDMTGMLVQIPDSYQIFDDDEDVSSVESLTVEKKRHQARMNQNNSNNGNSKANNNTTNAPTRPPTTITTGTAVPPPSPMPNKKSSIGVMPPSLPGKPATSPRLTPEQARKYRRRSSLSDAGVAGSGRQQQYDNKELVKRIQRAYDLYNRMGRPTRDKCKQLLSHAIQKKQQQKTSSHKPFLQPQDIDNLPWNVDGTEVSEVKMSKFNSLCRQ